MSFYGSVYYQLVDTFYKIAAKNLDATTFGADEAGQLNDVQAKKYLVDCYLMGIGTKQDEDKAFKLAEELYNSKNIYVENDKFYTTWFVEKIQKKWKKSIDFL
mgnify:CR=1 FL=1